MLRDRLLTFISVFLLSLMAYAESLPNPHPTVKQILQSSEEPDGIVFDIETLQSNALGELAPYVRQQILLIKNKFPDVDIAVVTHGVEEYALQRDAQKQNAGLHDMFNRLVQDQDVSVHVCGAVGGLKNLTQEDFPEFVSYSESGMAQINDYKALGYTVVAIKQLSEAQRKDLFEHKEKYIK